MEDKRLGLFIFNNFFNYSSSDSNSDSDSDSCNSNSSEDDFFDDDVETIYTILMLDDTCGDFTYKASIPNYVERVVPTCLIDEFKSNFRMLPSTFEFVLSLIGRAITSTASFSGRRTIDADKQLKLALYYMAAPNSYRYLCEKFKVGRATVVRTLRRVAYALHCLAPQWIRWPKNNEALKISQEFEARCGFPKVIGALAGTQVNVPAPKEDACSIVNRKGDYSFHLQAVCDARSIFTHCVAGNVESVHDSCVEGTSPLARYLSNPSVFFPEDTHLIGDTGYGIHPQLQVPFGDNGQLTEAQSYYNSCLSSGKAAVERAFGLLKGRFKCVQDNLPFSDRKKIPEFVIACCVLHNICLLKNDNLDDEDCVIPILAWVPFYNDSVAKLLGEQKRERIMNQLLCKLEPVAT